MKYVTELARIPEIPETERARLALVAQRYVFRANAYYLSLIDWSDPNDPIRRLVIPDEGELEDWGELDASNEAENTPVRGVQHKYPRTVLLLCNEVCGAYCRYCFRKRLFMNDNDEVSLDVSRGLAVIDLALSVPHALRHRQGQGKWILRSAMMGHLPSGVTRAKTDPFRAPDTWFVSALTEARVREAGLVRPEAFAAISQRAATDHAAREGLYKPAVLHLWHERWYLGQA